MITCSLPEGFKYMSKKSDSKYYKSAMRYMISERGWSLEKIKKHNLGYTENKGNRKPSGFAKPSKISSELCEFMGKENGAEVARTEVTQFVIAYIKQNKLAESKNIIPDKKLTALLGIENNSDENVTYFNIQKYMNRHFPKASSKMQEA